MQPRLTTIHLESNTLRTEALQYLIQQLEIKKVSTLECLRIRGKYKVKIANSLLKKLKKKLKKYSSKWTDNFLGCQGLFCLIRALKHGAFPNLKILVLDSCLIQDKGANALLCALRKGFCKELRELSLQENFIKRDAMEPFMKWIGRRCCPKLEIFNGYGNDISIPEYLDLGCLIPEDIKHER